MLLKSRKKAIKIIDFEVVFYSKVGFRFLNTSKFKLTKTKIAIFILT